MSPRRSTTRRTPVRPRPVAAPTPATEGLAVAAQARAARQQRRAASRIPTTPADHGKYQGVILAEFVAAMLLTAATPFTRKNQPGISPYAGKDVVQLAALVMVYLILALVSVGGRGAGRVSAWLGGLVLITVGLGEAATIGKTLNVFGAGGQPAAAEATAQGAQEASGGSLTGGTSG